MNNLKWHLFAVRTQIEMRMLQLGLNSELRTRIVRIIARVSNIPRLMTFADRLDAKQKRVPRA